MTDKVCWRGTTTVGLLALTGWPGRAEISTAGRLTWYLSAVVRCTVSSRRDFGGPGPSASWRRREENWRNVKTCFESMGVMTACNKSVRWRVFTALWWLDQGGGEEWVLVTPTFTMEGKCIYLQYFEFWNRIFYFYVQPLLWTYCSPGSWSIIIISTANETGDIQNSLCHIKERTTGSRVPPSVLSSHIIVNYFYVYVCLSLLWKSMINK